MATAELEPRMKKASKGGHRKAPRSPSPTYDEEPYSDDDYYEPPAPRKKASANAAAEGGFYSALKENRYVVIAFIVIIIVLLLVVVWLVSHKENANTAQAPRHPPARRPRAEPPFDMRDDNVPFGAAAFMMHGFEAAPYPPAPPATPAHPAARPSTRAPETATAPPPAPAAAPPRPTVDHSTIVATADDKELNHFINVNKRAPEGAHEKRPDREEVEL